MRYIFIFLRSYRFDIVVWKIKCKIFKHKIPNIGSWQKYFNNKKGLEIGGPSPIFKKASYLELYDTILSLDGVNFSNKTIWEGKIDNNKPYKYGNKVGKQYISEGSNLKDITDGHYDFVISCNNLEHIANPIAAIYEWKRVIHNEGLILLILPNKVANFDHKRPYTTMGHLISDFENCIDENDITHINEILELHDLRFDPQAGNYNSFKRRCYNNITNRCLHHHVFSDNLLLELFKYCNMETVLQHTSKTDLFILAKKS